MDFLVSAVLFVIVVVFFVYLIRNGKLTEAPRPQRKRPSENRPDDEFDVSTLVQTAAPDYAPPPASSDEPVYVIIDVETTGLSPEKDTIVQVSALRFFGKKAIDGLNTYINPCRPISKESTAIHGITNDKVKDSPTIEEVKEPFLNLIKGAILVGHNVTFDLKFLDQAFHGALDGVEYIDTMWLAKTLLNLPNYRLETVADYAEFHPKGGYHDSLTDCTATAAIFFRLALDKPGLAKTYYSRVISSKRNREAYPPEQDQIEGEAVLYMNAVRQICQNAGISINLYGISTEKGFDIVHNMYIWFRVKLSGKLHYLLVPMSRAETENLLGETSLEITDASKSETPHSHCRIMINSSEDFHTAAPVIIECVKQSMQYM